MANHVLLDNVIHSGLRVITRHAEFYGDNVISTTVFPSEFVPLQKEYPIIFGKNGDVYEPVALFGFQEKENLFLTNSGWDAKYIPLTIERQPFLIGFQEKMKDGVPVQEPVIYIDIDSPRISETEGEAVFLEQGGNSSYMQHISSVLSAIHEGYDQNNYFSSELEEMELFEPFTLKVEFNNHDKHELQNFYTINEDRLKLLPGVALEKLHKNGCLAQIYMVLASLSNIKPLIDRKNARL